jgi:hypothetical protein
LRNLSARHQQATKALKWVFCWMEPAHCSTTTPIPFTTAWRSAPKTIRKPRVTRLAHFCLYG